MNLTYGSRGDEVKKLQQALNSTGKYTLDVDGKYGPATQSAVKDYQTQNGLKVDGIAGTETLGRLYQAPATGSQTQQTTQQPQQPAQTQPNYSQHAYDPSADAAYQQALSALQQAQQALPTYKGSYDQQLQDIYSQIVNRDKFSYDLNSDMLYQQYADQYAQQGKMAMMDTMGQAAALTGGYSSSYGQSVGQQQYDAYLQQLNDVVPELYGMALDQYNQEGQDMLNQYAMVGDMADDEYGKYQDSLNQYWQNLSYLKGQADDAYQMGFQADSTGYDRQQDAYGKLVSLITTTGYTPTAEELAAAGMSEGEMNAYRGYYTQQNAPTGGSGGPYSPRVPDDSDDSDGNYNNLSYTTDQVKRAQQFIGVTADGKWGAESAAAAKKKGYGHLGAVIEAMEIGDAEDGVGGVASTAGKYFDYNPATNAQLQAEKGGSYYSTALADLQEMKQAGMSNAQAASYLKDMIGNSLLTQSEYSRLYNLYRDGNL